MDRAARPEGGGDGGVADVDAGGDLPSDEAILTIPPAGMDTVTLDPQTQAKLGTRGWVNFMSMIIK